MILSLIKSLKQKINKLMIADEAYESSTPIMTDSSYDSLRESALRDLEIVESKGFTKENYKIVNEASQYLGSMRNSLIGKKINNVKEHYFPVTGLDKVDSYQEVLSYLYDNELDSDEYNKFLVEPKYDGIKLSLLYLNGDLEKILTRGNGYQGEDLFSLLQDNKTIIKKINIQGKVQINGEFILSKEAYELICRSTNKKYKNARSALMACVNNKNVASLSNLVEFFPYSLQYSEDEGIQTMKEVGFLQECGFITQQIKKINKEEMIELVDDIRKKKKTACGYFKNGNYDCDGIVITSLKYQNRSIAIKPILANFVETRIKSFKWKISGKIGRLTCEIRLDPVFIEGKTYSKLTLNDYDLIEKELMVNRKIVVSIVNEYFKYEYAITDETEEVTRIKIPDICPECSEPLSTASCSEKNKGLYCLNKKCFSVLKSNYTKLNKALGFSASDQTMKILINKGVDNLYKYLEYILSSSDVFAERIKSCDKTKLMTALNVPSLVDKDYQILLNILKEVGTECDTKIIKSKIVELYKGDVDARNFSRKLNQYCLFCENHEWIGDFYKLIQQAK